MKTSHLFVIISCILVGVLGRLIPHVPDATPMTAVALLAAWYAPRRLAILVPFAALVISDLFIGLYDVPVMVSVYLSWILIALLSQLARNKVGATTGMTLLAAPLFFILTNFSVWAFSAWSPYPHTLAGLILCYEMGLPFLRNMLVGDLVCVPALFAAYYAARIMFAKFHVHTLAPVSHS